MANTDLIAILNSILTASAVVKDRAILGLTYIRSSERKTLTDGFAALKALALTQPADKKWTVVPSPTGQLVSGYPSGTVPPPPGNPPVWAFIPDFRQKSAGFSIDISTFLTGGYDTLSMTILSGALPGTGWAFSNPSLVYSGTGAGLLTVRFTATKNGLSSDSNIVTIESIALPAVDTIAPPTPTNLAVTLNGSNQPVVTFWPSADPAPPGQVWSGMKDYPIYRNGSLLTRVSAPAGLQASLAELVLGSPGGSSSFAGSTVTLTSVGGTSYAGTNDEGRGQGFPVTGNFTAIGRLASCVSTYQHAKAFIEFRVNSAQNSARVTAQHKPYLQGSGSALQVRGTAGASNVDSSETPNSTSNLLIALVRTNAGVAASDTHTMYTKVVGGGLWSAGPSAQVNLPTQGTVLFGASANAVGQPAGVTISASWQDIVITQSATLSYTDTTATVGTTPSYTGSARDLALNESAVSTAIAIAISSSSTWPQPSGVANSAVYQGMSAVRCWASLGAFVAGAVLCLIDTLADDTRCVPTANYLGTGVTVYLCSFREWARNSRGLMPSSKRIGMPIISGVCATAEDFNINDAQLSWIGATARAPGFLFNVNFIPRFNNADQTWQDIFLQCDNSTGGQAPDVVLDNRDNYGFINNAVRCGVQRVSAGGSCDECFDPTAAKSGFNGVIDFLHRYPISKSGRGAAPGFEDKKYHGYGPPLAYEGNNFDMGNGLFGHYNGRSPYLARSGGMNCWNVYTYNDAPNPDGIDTYQGGAEIYGSESPYNQNVTINNEGICALAGPNTQPGRKPWNLIGVAPNLFSANSKIWFDSVTAYDPLGTRWNFDQSTQTGILSLNSVPASVIASGRNTAQWVTGITPVRVTWNDVPGHIAKLNLIKRYSGFRPLERTVGPDAAFVDQPLNYIQQINPSNWGAITNVAIGLVRPGDFPSTTVDLTAGGDPCPFSTFFTPVVCADGVTRIQGLRWAHRKMKAVGAQDWGQ